MNCEMIVKINGITLKIRKTFVIPSALLLTGLDRKCDVVWWSFN